MSPIPPQSESQSQSQSQSDSTGSLAQKSDTSTRTEADLAWAAGFLDGEGCINIAKQRYKTGRSDTYRLGVSLAQNNLPTLEAFRTAVGIPSPIHPTKRADNHSRQCYTLNFSGKKARLLLITLMPYFRRKLKEATAVLEFWTEGRVGMPGNGKRVDPGLIAKREYYYLLLQRLK